MDIDAKHLSMYKKRRSFDVLEYCLDDKGFSDPVETKNRILGISLNERKRNVTSGALKGKYDCYL